MNAPSALAFLKITAVTTAVLALGQMVLGFGWLGSFTAHGWLGNLTLLFTWMAALASVGWFRGSGDKGIALHAGGMAILATIQLGLGELGFRLAHQVTGVVFLVGALALATLALRRAPDRSSGPGPAATDPTRGASPVRTT